ncbi:sigma-54-dependent Fis family transcriptional regulator [bacterium M21]|nr:sigma-54-dependent Fis family transcriptional regulator [bacterium M21]
MNTILVVDDEQSFREIYASALQEAGFQCTTAADADEAAEIMKTEMPALVITDVRMPGKSGLEFLEESRSLYPDVPFLLVTAYSDVKDAVTSLKLGAVDYLMKPIDLTELIVAADSVLGVQSETKRRLPEDAMKGIIVENPDMLDVFVDAHLAAQSNVGILITGESGTGKEVLAQFVHRNSPRSGAKLVPINCAAIPKELLGSELFGHAKGAFTGAMNDRAGCFKEADGGTLFLDEIGDMPLSLQPALLRALETGTISPVGSDTEIDVDFRLVAATNRNLLEEVKAGRFREDLYYRLNVISFEMLPLRQRPEDLLPIARHVLKKGSPDKRFAPATERMLQNYDWPGNVRELTNAIERARILSNADIILPEHLPPVIRRAHPSPDAGSSSPLQTLKQMEVGAIKEALERTGGNRTKTAELLGISRRALLYKLREME